MARRAEPRSAAQPTATQIEGIVEDLHLDREGHVLVVRFLVSQQTRRARNPLTAVEMRGEQLLGVLSDGHRISLAASSRGADGTARPAEVRNLTTNATVAMSRPGLARRVIRGLAPAEIRTALISGLVGAGISIAVGTVARGGSDEEPGLQPAPDAPVPASAEDFPGWLIAIAVVLAAAGLVALITRAKRNWGRAVSALIGLLAGVLAVALLLFG